MTDQPFPETENEPFSTGNNQSKAIVKKVKLNNLVKRLIWSSY